MTSVSPRWLRPLGAGLVLLSGCSNENLPPRLTATGPFPAFVGQQFNQKIFGTDPDGDRVTLSLDSNDSVVAGLTATPLPDQSLQLSWTPAEEAAGMQSILIAATDGKVTVRTPVFIDVRFGSAGTPIFREPVGTGVVLDLSVSDCQEVPVTVEDSDSPMIELTERVQPPGSEFIVDSNGWSATWRWCPDPDTIEFDNYRIVFVADDGDNPPQELPYVVGFRRASDGPADDPRDEEGGAADEGSPPQTTGPTDEGGADVDDGSVDGGPMQWPTGSGSCCEGHTTPSCEDDDVVQCVCDVDDYCCTDEWDTICVVKALENDCGCVDCCTATPGHAGCGNETIKDCVCALDMVCCTTDPGWDGLCVSEVDSFMCGMCP